jgi:hypothetical protein
MLVLLNRKTLEAPLIQRTGPGRVMVRVPPLRVRHRQQAQEFAQVAVLPRPEHQMPMVGHQAVTHEAHGQPLMGALDDAFHRLVIRVILEQQPAPDSAVEDVIGNPAGRDS